MFKRICKITFITHGETIHTQDGIISDSVKSPKLNEFGEEDIERVCDYLKKRGVSYDVVYTSPMAYCTQTANIVAKIFHKKPVQIDLKSRNHGDWQGKSYKELFEELGNKAISKTPPNGETIKHFNKRVASSIEKLLQDNKGNRIIVVTTPEVVQAVLANVLEITPENQYKLLVKTGSLTQVSYFEDWASVIYSDYKPL